jgi:hypothetical protein
MGLHIPQSSTQTAEEARFIQRVLGKDFCELMTAANGTLAGGALTSIFSNSEINDFDIFFPDVKSFEFAVKYMDKLQQRHSKNLMGNFKDIRKVMVSDRAHTYGVDLFTAKTVEKRRDNYGPVYDIRMPTSQISIQFVSQEFNCGADIDEIFSRFDFTVCMGSYNFKTGNFKFDPRFFVDLAKRSLRFNPDCIRPIMSIFRMKKYETKGFTITAPEVFKICATLMNYKVKTYRQLIDEFGTLPDPKFRAHLEALVYDPKDEYRHFEGNILDEEVQWEDVIQWVDDYHQNGMYVPNSVASQNTYEVKSALGKNIDFFDQDTGNIIKRIENDEIRYAQIADNSISRRMSTRPQGVL